jgi:hypothetical protein
MESSQWSILDPASKDAVFLALPGKTLALHGKRRRDLQAVISGGAGIQILCRRECTGSESRLSAGGA